MEEIWKDIKDFEGLYQVSNLGRVRSLNYHREGKIRMMKPKMQRCGYLQIGLFKDGKQKLYYVHRLVAEAFIPNPDRLPCVNHKDECKTNNITFDDGNGGNLEWCDHKYNSNYGTARERMLKKQRNNPNKSKRVYQYTLDGSFVRSYPSTNEAERQTGIHNGSISHCCLGKPKHKSAGNYRWSYDPPKPTTNRTLF